MKKKYIFPFIYTLTLLFIFSCDNKRDDNGDFGGMWQLTHWIAPSGDTLATKENRIFYCVKLQLIKFENLNETGSDFYCYFKRTVDSLVVYHNVENGNPEHPNDTLVTIDKLSKYGVPSDGHFHIDVLTNKNLILSSERGILTFRKY